MRLCLSQVTPLVRSAALTALLDSPTGREVFLKLENLQPGGRWAPATVLSTQHTPLSHLSCRSFKIRGMGTTMQRSGATRFMGSSGGNAGTLYNGLYFNVGCVTL